MNGNKIICYYCNGTGLISAYMRYDCWHCDRQEELIKLSPNASMLKCTNCETKLMINSSTTCPICDGDREIHWIDELFKGRK